MKRVALLALFLALTATSARASGMNVSWTECGAAGTSNRIFACNSNVGSHSMVVSFVPPIGITNLTGLRAILHLRSAAANWQDWWRFDASSCRSGSLTIDPDFAGFCTNAWAGQGTGDWSQAIAPGSFSEMTITVNISLPPGQGRTLSSEVEYTAFKLMIDDMKTVGTQACGGCATPVCIFLDQIRFFQPNAFGGDYVMCNAEGRDFMSWESGAGVPGGCPGTDSAPPPYCQTTGSARRTWGTIKSIYR